MYSVSENYLSRIYEEKQALKIYINGNKIEDRYVYGCKPSGNVFSNQELELGNTPSIGIELKLDNKALPNNIETIYIESGLEDELVPIGYFNIDNIAKDDGITTFTLLDNMVKFDYPYNGSKLIKEKGLATLKEVAQDICNTFEVELGSTSFDGMNIQVAVYDNSINARVFIGYIAEQAGCFAIIGRDGKLYFRKIGQSIIEYPKNYLKSGFKFGNYLKVTRVKYEDGIRDFKKGNEIGNTIYINQNNMYIINQGQIDSIYNKYNDLELYGFSGSGKIDPSIDIGDILVIDGKKFVYQGSSEYSGKFIASISSDIKTKEQQESTSREVSQKTINRRIESNINQLDGKITQIVEETTDTNEKISKVEQTVDELNSKISDVADITTMSESAYGKVTFTSINAGEPIYISIHPITNNISKMYPRTNLYPSNDLYMSVRILRFKNTKTNEIFNYELPDDLLCSGNIYDEFILNYDNQVCQIIKRRRYNSTGTTHVISEKRVDYPYPKIELTDGDYEVELVGYSTGYLQVRLMSQNIYTTQFATRAEVKSEIAQTATGINLEVAKKVGKEEIISSINQSAEQITIDANKISLNGKSINLTSDNIEIKSTNFNVDKNGNMKAQNGEFSGKITANSGYIGGQNGFTITENKIYNGKNTFDSNESGVYIGTNGIALGNDGAFLYSNGKAKFSNGLTVKSKNQNSVGFQLEGNTPYIDFLHNDSSESDFSSRIIENNPRRIDSLCI